MSPHFLIFSYLSVVLKQENLISRKFNVENNFARSTTTRLTITQRRNQGTTKNIEKYYRPRRCQCKKTLLRRF